MSCDLCDQGEAAIFLSGVVDLELAEVALCRNCGGPCTEAAVSPEQLRELVTRASSFRSRFSERFIAVAEQDPRYAAEAFTFVRDALQRASAALSRHVTAQELLDALRLFASERYGVDARNQLREWGVTRTEDFGEIVFALIEHGVFEARPEDKKEDFINTFEFASAFPVATPQV